MKHIGAVIILLCSYHATQAQSPGSVSVYGGSSASVKSITSGGTSADVSETLYIGPGTYVINGTWEIYSKNIVIDPAAVIGGTGSILIYNPSVAGGTVSRTFIDGNNNAGAMDVNVVINNASGVEITGIEFPSDLTSAGFVNNTSNNTVYLGKDLNLAVDGADIWLDADVVGDLRFDASATISNYSVARMVITNNVNMSHVVKDAGGTNFVYPVGIADGDYTPASITGTGTYHVSVTDYSPSSPIIGAPAKGMARTWHVYGDAATSVTLTHNTTTNGTSYADDAAFITRYKGSASWTKSESADYFSPGQHTNSGSIAADIPSTAASDGSYLSKTSDKATPLPVVLMSFDVRNENGMGALKWVTSGEANSRGFAIQHSTTAKEWSQIGYVGSLSNAGYSMTELNYNFTHASLQPGKNYYRLKMEDLDGTYTFSSIRVVHSDEPAVLSVYPNPVADVMAVSGIKDGDQLQLYDKAGRIVSLPGLAGLTDGRTADLSSLANGTYMLRVKSAQSGVTVLKFLKH